MIGAKAEVIEKAEDRLLFRQAMEKIGLESAPLADRHNARGSACGARSRRPAGHHPPLLHIGGRAVALRTTARNSSRSSNAGIDASPASSGAHRGKVLGWKEFEMEVVRDRADNCIIICSIENIDPMGVHTGDSITVAPALTLTDKEYQIMRDASIAVLREIGVETGGSNVQFAVNPADGRLVVIEMNPRVSRSSALASKATGFPIAKVAAKLAVGYTLDELRTTSRRARRRPRSSRPSTTS
jgi:carbamoyl-phosphate synthase large subunit